MSIYVSDGLKSRMDLFGDRINWSNIAQVAFETELVRVSFPQEPEMQDVIERLKASKLKSRTSAMRKGEDDGKQWAMKGAEYDVLLAISKLDTAVLQTEGLMNGAGVWNLIWSATIDPDDSPIWNSRTDDWHSPDYVIGFVVGAKQLWDSISDQL